MFVDVVEPKAVLPRIVGTLHEDSSSKGKDTWQMFAHINQKKPFKLFVLTADI